ncbi:MAG: hypothetical protein ABSD38_29830, partial [Syntrophorhabdales bacterium]
QSSTLDIGLLQPLAGRGFEIEKCSCIEDYPLPEGRALLTFAFGDRFGEISFLLKKSAQRYFPYATFHTLL